MEAGLLRGLNYLQLEAKSARRALSEKVVVNYVPPPFELVLDRLVPKKAKGEGARVKKGAGGVLSFPEAEHKAQPSGA